MFLARIDVAVVLARWAGVSAVFNQKSIDKQNVVCG
jgi:hypothetical protein